MRLRLFDHDLGGKHHGSGVPESDERVGFERGV